MGGYSLSTLVKIKSIVKFVNTTYHSYYTSYTFNVPTKSFNPSFNCDEPDHGVGIFPLKKD